MHVGCSLIENALWFLILFDVSQRAFGIQLTGNVYWWDAYYCSITDSTTLLLPTLQCSMQASCSIIGTCLYSSYGNVCAKYEMNTADSFVEIPGKIPSHLPVEGCYQFADGSQHNFSGGFALHADHGHNCARKGWLNVNRGSVNDCLSKGAELTPLWDPITNDKNVVLSVSIMGNPLPPDAPAVHLDFNHEFSTNLLLDGSQSTCRALSAGLFADHIVSFEADFASYFITASLPCHASDCLSIEQHPDSYRHRCCSGAVVSAWRYLEAVPPVEMMEPPRRAGECDQGSIEKLRYYSSHWKDKTFPAPPLFTAASPPKARHVCLYFSAKTSGMTHKLLHMMEALPTHRFQWTYFACLNDETDLNSTILSLLALMNNVQVRPCLPTVAVSPEDILEQPTILHACDSLADAGCNSNQKQSLFEFSQQKYGPDSLSLKVAFEYAILCLRSQAPWTRLPSWDRAAQDYSAYITRLHDMINSTISPAWVGRLWSVLLSTMAAAPLPCEVLVVGNDRSPVAGLIPEVARLLRIPRCSQMTHL